MNILIISATGQSELKTGVSFIPSVGDRVDVFYEPLPTVTSVVAYPSIARIEAVEVTHTTVDAIITVR